VAAIGRKRNNETVTEDLTWDDNANPSVYGKSKYLAELEVWRAYSEGLDVAIVNPVVILGVGNWLHGSSATFKSAFNEFPWYTEGVSGFVDVLDVIDAMQRLMESDIEGQRYIISADNIPYRTIFNLMANAFNKKPPYRKVTPLLAAIVWRLEAIKGFITRQSPLLTKETTETAQAVVHFNNSKFLTAFPSFQYRSMEQTIQRVAAELKKQYQL
jgi:nucleoside-diphosphate-sugar epimerase